MAGEAIIGPIRTGRYTSSASFRQSPPVLPFFIPEARVFARAPPPARIPVSGRGKKPPTGGSLAVSTQDEQRLALFIDFENIAIGVRDAHYRKFDVNLVLERLLDKGKLLVKKAYADSSRYSDYKRSFHEAE